MNYRRKFRSISLFIMLISTGIGIPSQVIAQDNINKTTSGTIAADEIWRDEIHLVGDIFFDNGATLTIEPGTIVFVAANSDTLSAGSGYEDQYTREHDDPVRLATWSRNAILIDGRRGVINAIGTSDEPIVFRPEGDSASVAQWDGVYIERGTLQYAQLFYGGRTAVQILGDATERVEIAHNEVRHPHWAGIDVQRGNVWIHHNFVVGGGHQAITARSDAVVEHNEVYRAQTGIGVERSSGVVIRNNIIIDSVRGIELRSGSEISVINNVLARIEGPPEGWSYQGQMVYPAFAVGGAIEQYIPGVHIDVENNIIYGDFAWGIGLHQPADPDSLADFNIIFGPFDRFAGNAQGIVGSHNVFADPLFASLDEGDFRLSSASPAIDAGSPELKDPDDSPSDIGTYGGPFAEWTGEVYLTVCIITGAQAVNIRAAPGTAFDITGTLNPGETYRSPGQFNAQDGYTWWNLGQIGWVRADVVSESPTCADLPIIEP